MAKITIMHVITGLDMGGAERMLSNIASSMDKTRFNNIVISLRGLGHWGPRLQQQGITVYALDMQPNFRSLFRSLAKVGKLWRLMRQHRPDCVQGWMYHGNLIALLIGKLAGMKNIYWNIRCSSMDLSHYNFSSQLVYKLSAWLSRMPNVIVNNSQASITQHKAGGFTSKCWKWIPNGFDLDKFKPDPEIYAKFRQQHNLPADAKLIGMLARFDPMKDHASFLQAAALFAAMPSSRNVYFVLAGTNITRDNPAIAQWLIPELEGRVLLLGPLGNVHEILPALDFLTLTSTFGEGFPNVLGEAMACGVPCFTTDVGDSLAVIGDTGYAIPCGDPQTLAQGWGMVLASDYKCQRETIRYRIAENFSLPRVVQMYEDVYGKR